MTDREEISHDALTKRKWSTAWYVVLFVWIASILGWAMHQQWSYVNLYLPLIVGIPTLALILLQLSRIKIDPAIFEDEEDMFGSLIDADDGAEPQPATEPETGQGHSIVVLFGWVILLPAMMFLLGIRISFPIYLVALVWYLTEDVRKTALASVLGSLFVYVMFYYLLGVISYTGLLWRLV